MGGCGGYLCCHAGPDLRSLPCLQAIDAIDQIASWDSVSGKVLCQRCDKPIAPNGAYKHFTSLHNLPWTPGSFVVGEVKRWRASARRKAAAEARASSVIANSVPVDEPESESGSDSDDELDEGRHRQALEMYELPTCAIVDSFTAWAAAKWPRSSATQRQRVQGARRFLGFISKRGIRVSARGAAAQLRALGEGLSKGNGFEGLHEAFKATVESLPHSAATKSNLFEGEIGVLAYLIAKAGLLGKQDAQRSFENWRSLVNPTAVLWRSRKAAAAVSSVGRQASAGVGACTLRDIARILATSDVPRVYRDHVARAAALRTAAKTLDRVAYTYVLGALLTFVWVFSKAGRPQPWRLATLAEVRSVVSCYMFLHRLLLCSQVRKALSRRSVQTVTGEHVHPVFASEKVWSACFCWSCGGVLTVSLCHCASFPWVHTASTTSHPARTRPQPLMGPCALHCPCG